MKRVFAFAVCAVALVLSSLVAAQMSCDVDCGEQTTHEYVGAIETALSQEEDNAFEWSYTGVSFCSSSATGAVNLNKRPNHNFSRQQSDLDLYLIKGYYGICPDLTSVNPIRNFVAFRHHNQPRYYIFDLHRIRI